MTTPQSEHNDVGAMLGRRVAAVLTQCRDDDALTDEACMKRVLQLLHEAWPSAMCARLASLTPTTFLDVVSSVEWMHGFARSPEPEQQSYPERLVTLAAEYVIRPQDVGSLLCMARALSSGDYPLLRDAVDVTNGSGSSAIIHEATNAAGKRVIVKTDRIGMVSIHRSDVGVVQGLEPYGGPACLGEVRFFDRHGVIRHGVCMELVPGLDLQRLYARGMRGEALPYRITEAHLASLRAFETQLAEAGKAVSEVNRGDFMLRPDGAVVPLDMYVVELTEVTVCQGLNVNGTPIATFIEDVVRRQRASGQEG